MRWEGGVMVVSTPHNHRAASRPRLLRPTPPNVASRPASLSWKFPPSVGVWAQLGGNPFLVWDAVFPLVLWACSTHCPQTSHVGVVVWHRAKLIKNRLISSYAHKVCIGRFTMFIPLEQCRVAIETRCHCL